MKKNYLLITLQFILNKPVFYLLNIKKIGFLNIAILFLALLVNTNSKAQNLQPFSIRYATELKGDMLVIGNNILGKDNNPLNDNTTNQSVSMQYIDIDNDATTYNSSSADLAVPSGVQCFRIAYAGLYWGALIKTGDSRTDINKIKFKTPGSSTYTDITGTTIYDNASNPIDPDANKPYACYYDVTSIIAGLTNPQGTYTVANVKSSTGLNGATGLAAGWTLYVIYEDPNTTKKYMVSYDGMSALYDGRTLDIDVGGFLTAPSGPINLKFGFATLNGDKSVNSSNKTKVEISNGIANGTALTTTLRPSNYFFNSSITNLDSYSTSRNPNGTNSLGYDTGIEQLLNVNKSTIGNNATNVRFTLQVARGQANPLFSFFNAFQVNVIAPDISLTKLVKDISGNDIGNTDVVLGTNLYYEIGFQSSGNDNVTNFTLKDVLPNNVIFNYPSDIISLPTGVTHTYNATTRQLVFTIPDNLVEVGDVAQTIRLHVQVVSNYKDLLNSCSNEIKNQAFASYRGVINTTPIVDEGSFASTVCNFGTPSSTNFLVNINGQTFSSNAILCGASVQLTGPSGYTSYSWSTSPTGTPIIGTNQTYNATNTGTYYITSTSACATVTEAITVNPFGNTITNPVIPFADEVVVCPNNGKDLPNIFLCGANATRYIQTNISDASSIVWQKLNESSCPAITVPNCANENTSCQWNTVGTGPNYTANTSGQFRLTINYPGGCFSIFYFNVYQNILNPTATTRDIICTKNGEITINGVPSGYEYSLDGTTYQSSNVFSIATAGSYTVYIRQVGVTTNPCIFSVPNILIRQRNFTASTIITQPLCNGDKGSINIGAQDAYPQYYYSIYQGTTLVNSVGPIVASDYEFSGLNSGTYTVRVWTDDGCDYTENVTLTNPPLLSATSALTKSLTCTDGEITVYPTGGTPPYNYYINGTITSQTFPQIVVSNPLPTAGLYTIIVEDSNGCQATTSITVAAIPPPVYTVNKTDVLCYNNATGSIAFNVSNANGYTLSYSINNGATYTTNPTFSNLSAGTYNAMVKYSLAGTDCFTTAQPITITQPAAALTATATVTELAGCGPSGEGKIAITNAQGGTAPYQYSFDNQATWSSTNTAYKVPGTYTVYVKDANSCTYTMTITIAPVPDQPTIAISNPTFNCDGTVNSTVTVTTVPNANYSYQYFADGVINSNVPANVFTNLASGNHTISVKYISTSSATACIPQSDFLVVIPTGKTFTSSITATKNLSCSGANDGQITIAASNFDATKGFQHSINNGTSWNTQMTSPYTITGLIAGTYNIIIRYDSSSPANCTQTYTQTITAPSPLVTTASVTALASCTAGATILATSTGGTPAYRFELWDVTATTNIVASQNSGTFTNINPGTYIIRSYDVNNCTDDSNAITVTTPPSLAAVLSPSSDFCYDSTNQATLIVTASGGTAPFVYSLDGAPSQNSNTFNNVTTGTHTIIVTDSYGCTATISNITIAPELAATISNVKELDCTASPNAVISGSISGGYAPYVVTIISGTSSGTLTQPTATTFSYTTATASTYQFQIQDAKGCITTTTATINPLVAITANLTTTNPSCNGTNDGSIQIIPSGGVGPYTYSIDGTNYVSGSLFSSLAAGNYTLYIKDSKDCFISKTTTLVNPTTLTTTTTVVPFSCSATNTKQSATITINVPTTGTAPYLYSFNGGGFSTTNTLIVNDNGSNQTINYAVKDDNGCSYSNSVTLSKLNPPVTGSIGTTPITCSVTTSTVTVTPSAGTGIGTLTYEIISPTASATSNTTGVFNGLAPNTYVFKVTDANGCYYTQSHTVLPVTRITVSGNVTSDVLCKGGNTGSAVFTVSNFLDKYSYNIIGGTNFIAQTASTINLNNLTAGTYTINITDEATSCTASTSVTITEPTLALALSAITSNINCNNDNAQITITATGGTQNYSYAAVVTGGSAPTTFSTSNIVTVDTNSGSNLSWDVYVKDANGCTAMISKTINADPLPSITTPAIQCYVGTPINITISGTAFGTSTYSIGSGYQSNPNFTINTPGTYTLSIRDANGCIASTTYTVYPQLNVLPLITKELDCTATPNATITLNVSGGLSTYNYAVSTDDGSTYLAMASNVYSATTDGTYTFKVTDANNCIATNSITLAPLQNPTAITIDSKPSCNGNTDGSVQIIPSGGVGPYTFSFNGSAFTTTSLYTGLSAGINYSYEVRDSKNCSYTGTVTLTEPTTLTTTATVVPFSCNTSNGKVSATITIEVPTTGTAPYQYSFNGSTYSNANVLTVNDNGTDQNISYSVRDANGCIFSKSITLSKLNPPTNLSFSNSPITCSATTTTVTAVATNGVGSLTYEIKSPSAAVTSNTTGSFAGLSSGTYLFKVSDANGCYYTESYTIKPVTPIAVVGNINNNVFCKGGNNGSATFTVSGFAGSYSYSINGGSTTTGYSVATINLNNQAAGSYTVAITDETTSCTATTSVTITEPTDALALTATPSNINCNNDNSQITANATGGTLNYSYAAVITGASAPTTFSTSNFITVDTNSGADVSWDVYVKDANGCTAMTTLNISSDPLPTVTTPALASNQCSVSSGYTFTATGTGVAPLSYSINGGLSYQNSPTFTVNAPGSYTVKVKDANGCTSTSSTPTIVYPKLTLNTILNKVITCSAPSDAQITLTAANGNNASYTYAYSTNGVTFTNMTSNVYNTSTPGSYTFRVTDANGCTATTPTAFVLTAPASPEIIDHTQTQDIYCNGESTAAIRINIDINKGLAPFTYSIDGTNFQSSNVFSSLAAGNYTVILKDSNGCTDTYPVTINQPNAFDYTLLAIPMTCPVNTPGSITIQRGTTGLGGTAPYTYTLTNNAGYPTQIVTNDPGTSDYTFVGLNFATYYVTVTDANGCSLKTSEKVASPPSNLNIVVESTADCTSGGTVKVTVGGAVLGAGPFYFAIYQQPYPTTPTFDLGGNVEPPFQAADASDPKSATFTGLLQGVYYSFMVYDMSTGCSYIRQAETPTIKATSLATLRVVTDVTCKGANDGTVLITLNTNSTDPFYSPPTSVDYSVYDSKTNLPLSPIPNEGFGITVNSYPFVMPLIGGLAPGSYYVVITEHGGSFDGCSSATLPFDIYESATVLELTATVVKKANCNTNAGQITAVAKGGTTMSREDEFAAPPQVATPVPYQYQILSDTGTIGDASDDVAPLSTDSNWGTINTFYKDAGNYIVYAMDANKCIKAYPITLDSDASPTIDTPATICYDGNPFTITITGTVDPAIVGGKTYSINGSTFQSSPNFTFNAAGTYNLVIKDGNGCTANVDYVVYPQLQLDASLTKELDCTTSPNAEITLTAIGGNPNPAPSYSYEYSTDAGANWNPMASNVYSAATAGTYDFKVTDNNNPTTCQATTSITIADKTATVFTTSSTNVKCNGSNEGTITVNVTSGNAPYQYKLDGAVSYAYQSSNQFSGLIAGTTYIVTVRDSKMCEYSSTAITITEPIPLSATSTLTTPLSCGAGNAAQAATVTVSGQNGIAPYTYSFNRGVTYTTSNTYQAYAGTTFDVWVKDANACTFKLVNGVNIPALNPPTDLDFSSTPILCMPASSQTSTVTLSVTNGVLPLSYQILFPASTTSNVTGATSGIFTGLAPDTYLFQVTDANGCTYQESYTVAPVTNITVAGQLISDATCNGANNGQVQFTVTNFVGTYSYTINGGIPFTAQSNPTITLSGLATGTQTIVVTDETTGCQATASVTDAEPTVIVLTETKNSKANCNFGAQVSVSATGGTPGYTYAFVQDGASTVPSDFKNSDSVVLDPAINTNWDAWAKDANGCTTKLDITIAKYDDPTINPVAPQCFTGAPITITLSGTVDPGISGSPTYSIGGAYQNSPNFTINTPGIYTISIKDGNGCIASTTYEVKPQLNLVANLTQDLTCIVDASMSFTANGGTASYTTYEVSFNRGTFATASTPYVTNTAGSYVFSVTDSQGCQAISNEIIVSPNTTPTLTYTQTNVSCNGDSNGSVVVTAANGIAPYQYSIDNGITYQSSNVFTGLNAGGTYTLVVKDNKNCTSAPSTVTITEPTPLSATSTLTTALSCGAGNAAQAATVTVNGLNGTAPYTYSFNGGATYTTSNTYQAYAGTSFDVWVKDANACIFTLTNGVNIPALNPPTDLNFSSTPVYCMPLASQTSTVTLSTTNGVLPLNYQILFPASATSNVTGAANGIFTGLAPDTYLFEVTDANGCTYQESYTINPVTNISVAGQLISDVTCNGSNNGAVQFTVTNFAGTYSYTINGGVSTPTQNSATITLSGLNPGPQTIVVSDETTGCQATATITVTEPAALALTANPFINANCNFGAQVSVTASGGIPPYSYSYVTTGNPAGTYSNSASTVIDPAVSTTWDVWVKDSNGCVISSPLAITITTDPLPTVSVNPYSQCPSASGDYTFTLSPAGIAPFTYNIGAGFQSNPTFIVNAPGTYNVTVRDGNGCTTTVNALVNILPALQLEADITALPSCTDGDGALTLSAAGGSGNYEYSLDLSAYQSSANFTNIASGSHTASVRDITTNCTFSIPVTLEAATPVTGFALSKTDVTCNGGNDGVITATIATPATGINDNPVYMYSLSGAATRPAQTSNIFNGLAAGNYTVTVTSARGCTTTASIDITEPALIVIPTPSVVQFACNSGSNTNNLATITANGVTGGSGIYNYEFIKGGTTVQFGTSNVYNEANLLGGSYIIKVYDSKGCMATTASAVTINPYIALDKITVTVTNAITCNNLENITVSVSSIGGTPANLEYTVVDYNPTTAVTGALYPSQTNTTGIFTGLVVGNYLVTVKNLDTSCSLTTVHYVNEPNTFGLNMTNITDVSCFGGNNGSAAVTIFDNVVNATNPDQAGAFSYTIVDVLNNPVTSGVSATAGPTTISNLAAGIYTITATLTNSPYCSAKTNFTIAQPSASLTISESHTAITCKSGNNDGSISGNATGGWPGGYLFELVGPVNVGYSSQSTFTNLTAGNYTINVKDSKGCIASANVTLVIPTPISITTSADATSVSCFGDKNRVITVNTTTGGQGSNYMYSLNTTSLVPPISSGPQASTVFTGLGAGTYTVTVTDGYNCSVTSAAIVITEPTQINSSLMVTSTQTCLNQTRLTLSASGGTGIYTYSSDATFTNILGSFASSVTFPVPPGRYMYYVKDASGCIANVSNQIDISPLVPLTIDLDKTNAVVNCAGDNTGVIVATALGGLGNYSYTLLDGSGATVQGPTASGNFTGLFAGNYEVKVDSGDCTTTSAIITITQPLLPLTATSTITPVSCNGANNGIFTVNASGGTGIIKYAISPNLNQFFDTNVFNNLAPGNYDVIVQDALGCYVKINFDMTEPTPIRATTDANSIIPEVCYGDKDGAFSIDISGGVLPYSVNLDNPTGSYTPGAPTQTRFDFTGLTGGKHTVYILDANSCSYEWEVIMDESVKINPVATIDYSCVNNAASNSVTVTVDASITNPADLDYSLDGGNYQPSNVFTNIPPGIDHYIDVRHTNGCIKRSAEFSIIQIDPLTLTLSDGGLNEIVATASGGGGGYQYTFNGEDNGTKNTYIIYKSGNYTVQVTDANGCTAVASRYFEYIDVCIPNYFTPNGDGTNDGWAPGCTENYKDLTFDIFDRYGRKIASYHLGQKWDGKYNGHELPSGDYWYVLKLNDKKDNREFVGHFTLYR